MKLPLTPPDIGQIIAAEPQRVVAIHTKVSGPSVRGSYLHWDEVRNRRPPDDLSPEEWWVGLKLARLPARREVPGLVDAEGRPFSYVLTDEGLAMLHAIDRRAAGRVEAPGDALTGATRDRYLVRSLFEEAISSSLLEGAPTTRSEAKAMLRAGRSPRTTGERMVMNNYLAMQEIRQDTHRALTVDAVLEVHRVLTEGTLDDPLAAGRIQTPGDVRVSVVDERDGTILHRPPPADQLPDRMQRLVDFANDQDAAPFVHPVVRAVIVHFWLAYDHPFVDGNGRTARALFYRAMLREGYWLTEFLSISKLLYEAPSKYARAFLHSESDDNDLTYFLLHQLDVLRRSIDELYQYVDSRQAEVRALDRMLRHGEGLNHRQRALLSHALRHPDATYTIGEHRHHHDVVYQTARTDLLSLVDRGLLEQERVGREYRFYPVHDMEERLRGAGR